MAKKSVQEQGGIEAVFNALQSKYKDGLYMGSSISRKGVTSTGSIKLDLALNGGFVKGKIIECYGPESSGKSALAYALLSGIKGPKGFIDAESAYESETASMYGVDLSTMIVDRPEHIEQGMELVLDMVDAGMEAIVFDSIAGISTKAELEGSMEDHNVGKKASRMGQLMRKLHLKADEKGCTIFFVNQIRDSMSMYGSPVTTPGGHALQFHASYRLWVKGIDKIEIGTAKEAVGHEMKVNIKKNKFGRPGIDVKIPLIYGKGISPEWEILDIAVEKEIIEKSGSWYSYEGSKIGQGQYNTFTFLLDNPEFVDQIKLKIHES